MKTEMKISLVVLSALTCMQLNGVAMAEEDDKATANLSVSALSKYVYRGFELSKNGIVLQPSATVAYKGLSANVWGNEDTNFVQDVGGGREKWTETDLTLSYDWTIGPVGLTAGYTYYSLIEPDTQEVFGRAALHTLLTPTLTVYWDYDQFPGWYVTLGVSHTVPVTEKIGFSLGAQVGYLSADDASTYAKVNNPNDAYSGFHDGLLSASIAIQVNQYLTVTPVLNYSFPLTGNARDLIKATSLEVFNGGSGGTSDFLYGGVTVAMAF